MNTAYLLMGGNIGDTLNQFHSAIELMTKRGAIIQKRSLVYRTAAWGKTDQQDFLNQAIQILTPFDANEFMQLLLKIENDLGRKRSEKFGPRTIDLDIIFFNDLVIHEPDLTIPHPEVQNRRFALIPLVEIAPELQHPVLGRTVTELLIDCPDPLEVSLLV